MFHENVQNLPGGGFLIDRNGFHPARKGVHEDYQLGGSRFAFDVIVCGRHREDISVQHVKGVTSRGGPDRGSTTDCWVFGQLALVATLHVVADLSVHPRPKVPGFQSRQGARGSGVPQVIMKSHHDRATQRFRHERDRREVALLVWRHTVQDLILYSHAAVYFSIYVIRALSGDLPRSNHLVTVLGRVTPTLQPLTIFQALVVRGLFLPHLVEGRRTGGQVGGDHLIASQFGPLGALELPRSQRCHTAGVLGSGNLHVFRR